MKQATEDPVKRALEALAAADRSKQAPASIEADVLDGFRSYSGAVRREGPVPTPFHSPDHPPRWYQPAFWAVAGASAALAATLAVILFIPNSFRAEPAPVADLAEPGVRISPAKPLPTSEKLGNSASDTGELLPPFEGTLDGGSQAAGKLPPSRSGPARSPAPVAEPAVLDLTPPGVTAPAGFPGFGIREPQTGVQAEIATDFFPLMEVIPPFERGQIIRTVVPAATMREVGLPVHPDRIYEPVAADVLVGNDGIARAIRFVRTAQ